MTTARNTALIFILSILSIVTYVLGCASGYFAHYGQIIARRMNSDERFAQLALALNNYYHDHGHFPSVTWTSQEDGPRHSWRLALLPYMNRKSLFDEYDSSEPWNSRQNLKLSRQFTEGVPANYVSPFAHDCVKGATNYVGIHATTKQAPSGLRYARRAYMVVHDTEFFIVVEIPDSDIHWMEPRDAPASSEDK